MNKILLSAVLAAAGVAGPAFGQQKPEAGPTAAAATPLRPGLWETTAVVQTIGVDGQRTIVGRACFAPTDVADPARVLPRQREAGMKCENRDVRAAQGGKASWQIACTSPEGSLAGAAELTFSPTTYVGSAQLERKKRGAKAEKVTVALSAKWVEACK